MASPRTPDPGCLSVLCSCLKKRHRTRSQASDVHNEAAASAFPAAKGVEPATRRPAADERPATTAPGGSHVLSSASIETQPISLVLASDQESDARDCHATTIDLWQEAYDEVDDKTRNWVSNIPSVTNAKDPTHELVDLVRSREEKHKEEALKLKVGDREVLWRDYANRVVSVVTAIGDIAINFAPAPSSTIWSAVKVLLEANVTQCKDLVAIMGCTDMILCLVRRGRVYEEVYIGEAPRPTSQEDLKQKLVSVYKACLEFLAFVDEVLRQGNLTRFLDALLNPGHGEKRVSEMRGLEQELASAAHACEAKAGEEHRKLLQSLKAPLKRVDDNVTILLEKLSKDERERAMKYISTVPVGTYHNEKRETRTKDTCEWLINHPKFLEWEDLACSSVFWLQGNIGTGKSFLSSKVIDRYWDKSTTQLPSEHDEGVAYFYCSSSDSTRRSTHSILRSYIRQLSEIPRRPDSVHKASYTLYQKKDQVQDEISVKDCEETLIKMINSYPRTTLVLDALDECGEETRGQLVNLFKCLVQQSNRLLKIFISSRDEYDIRKHLTSFQSPQMLISISTSDNKGDIEKFVTVEMAKFSANWEFVASETKDKVKEVLVEKSNGMFRWTYLQWAQLKELKTNGDIKRRLGRLPKTLSGAYDEIYNQYDPDGCERVMLQRAVRWVMCARMPLNSCALLSAMEWESEQKNEERAIDKSDLTEQTLETVCRHLIVRDPNLGVWKFPHASVAEYFGGKDEPWVKNAKAEVTVFLINWLTDCCLNIVVASFKHFQRVPEVREWQEWYKTARADPDNVLDHRHPLQIYIHRNWLHHIHDLSDEDLKATRLVQALKQFLGETPQQPSIQYRVFWGIIMYDHFSYYALMDYPTDVKTNSAFAVVAMGLHRVLAGWWDKGLDLSLLSKLLPIAIQFGHTDLCMDLISRGCDINRYTTHLNQSALGMSIARRETDITRLLLAKGADPNRVLEGQSLLCLAVTTGIDHIHLLLENGADPSIKCVSDSDSGIRCPYDCAVSRAACYGNVDVLKALAGKGAALNLENLRDKYGSPLAGAACRGQLDCASFLIGQGANANALLASGKFGSPLAAAASFGRLECSRLLVNHGADVNAYLEFGEYGSVLAAAILGNCPSFGMVKFLVEEMKADPAQLAFMRPRRKERIPRKPWEQQQNSKSLEEIAAYLVHERQVEVQLLISLGVPLEAIPSGCQHHTPTQRRA